MSKTSWHMEPSWNIGDGYQRWCRGIGQTRYQMALVRPEILAFVTGCHIKYVKLSQPNSEVIRMFHPGLEGIELLEGKPTQGIYALAERARGPRISIYKFENEQDLLIAELKGGAENRYRSIRFNEGDLLLALSGVPEFCISLWRWSTGVQLMVVNCLDKGLESDLLISGINNDIWVEWSRSYITFYELQAFSNETNVIRSDIILPPNEAPLYKPDPRLGELYSIDIISVVFDFFGNIFVLDQKNGIYKVNHEDKLLVSIGTINLEEEAEGVIVEYIVPYDTAIAALLSSGTFLVLQVLDSHIRVKSRLEFSSRIRKYIQNPCALHPHTSFYAVTDLEKKLGSVLDGKMRAHYSILDLTFSEIQAVCFIERDSAYVAALTERGGVYILDSNTGNIFTKWKLPFYSESIISHPLLPMIAIGTPDGCVIYLEITDLKAPKIIYRSFICQDTEIDKLAWTCRGRYMIAGDTQRRHLFLTYGLPSMEFHYLDYSSLPGLIRAINTPASWKDKRLQVVLQERESEDVPFQINNYRLDGETLDLVASQLLDAPIKTLCFSSYKKLMYAYTCGNHCVGMVFFTEDMLAGSLKEPEIQFDGDLPLHVNRIILIGDKLFTFGEDGYVMEHSTPAPKATALNTKEVLQTHFPSYEGIKDGFFSMNGCRLITIGYDNTIVHVQLKPVSDMSTWGLLGYGSDMNRVIESQMKYLESLNLVKDVEIQDDELDGYLEALRDDRLYLKRRNEGEVKTVKEGLIVLRDKLHVLIEINSTRNPTEQLTLEEFELDDENEELEAKECEQDKQIAEIMIHSIIEEREKWVERMKEFMWDQFEVKVSGISGFNIKREVSNYPLRPTKEDNLKELEILRHERRLEKKLLLFDGELKKSRQEAIVKVLQLKKKRKIHRRKIDLSKYPPHLRDQMRKMMKSMTPDSDSDEENLVGISEEDQSKPSSTEVISKYKASRENDGDDEVESEDEEDTDEAEEEGEEEHDEELENGEDEENEDEEEEEEAEEEEGETTEKSTGSSPTSPTHKGSTGSALSTGPSAISPESPEDDKPESPDDIVKPSEPPPPHDKTIKERARKKATLMALRADEQQADDEEEEEGDELLDNDLDLVALAEEAGKIWKKKRRMVLKKVEDDEDDETMVMVEEEDSSDDSDSDVERQIKREDERALEREKRLSPQERERRKFVKALYSGSLTFEFFEPDALLYDQLDLAAFHEIHSQIKVIANEIRKLKILFNESFDEMKQTKSAEVNTIIGRNKRIREITDFFSIHIELKDPESPSFENPEKVFQVSDEEVPIEKYMTAEERRLAELARLEEEAFRNSKKDDFYERTLNLMMDGVLERRLEDILKKDIPKPHFMVTKDQWEWTPEEQVKAVEYSKKVEELQQMRTEYKREVETELRVLLKSNSDTKNHFDSRLKKLHEQKMVTELSIRMEEVKLSRMVRQIMKRYEIEKEETKLTNQLKKLQAAMKTTHGLASELATRADDCSIQYNALNEKAKSLERTFKIDLGEVGHFYDSFTKLYKKRPKVNLKPDTSGESIKFMIRLLAAPSLRSFKHNTTPNNQQVFEAIYELDDPMQTPVGCPRSTWDRFCRLRHEKMLCEYESKLIGEELNILHKVLVTFRAREDEGQKSIATVLTDLSLKRDIKLGHLHNAEFQMVLRQGQIELPRALIRSDFYNALLLRKHLVQSSNVYIRRFGNMKLAALQKTKNQHRAVKQIEWKFKKVQMKERHAQEKLRDINTLRITKDVLRFLSAHDDFKNAEKCRLENVKKLQVEIRKFHERLMTQKTRILKKFERDVTDTISENERKTELVAQRNLYVNEKRTECRITDTKETYSTHRERMLTIMRSAYLMRRIAKNAEEIFCLETELDRLYKKTFPLL